jgi:hypothetical protein
MNCDKEIYGVAKTYLRLHGEDAVLNAAMNADALLDAGDLDGQRFWLRVIEAIKVLSAISPSPGSRSAAGKILAVQIGSLKVGDTS